MKNLNKQFQNISHQHDLWDKESKIVLGISGGPDSACLLDIFSHLQKTYSLKLIIAHVNYGLRGEDSLKDENFVIGLANRHNIPIEILRPKKIGSKNLESELRDIRYNFFEKIRRENNFNLIAVAHNLDDQAETFLMRLLRGSGLSGLNAMKFKNGRIIRPLLSISRRDIITYLKESGLPYRTDKTNLESNFYRNKIRNELIPYLEKNYNPNIKKTLFNSTLSIGEDNSFLDDFVQKYSENTGSLSIKKTMDLHPAIQKRLILNLISKERPSKKDIYAPNIEEILKTIRSTKGKNQTVSLKGLKIMRKGDKVTISKL
jgi:tRNA(Ile)-lysidine synthase